MPLTVVFPKCYYCGIVVGDIFFCKRCSQYSHFQCLVEVSEADRCTHKPYIPAQSRAQDLEDIHEY